MIKGLLLRAAGVGALGGLAAFVFARIFAEPLIQKAIDYETGRGEAEAALAAAAGGAVEPERPEIFSRGVQANIGIGVGMVAFGLAMGWLFGVAYCLAYGRAGRVSPRGLSLLVALGGFLALYLVPFLKYPANPPAVGDGDTIGQRAGLYGVMVVACVVFGVAAIWLGSPAGVAVRCLERDAARRARLHGGHRGGHGPDAAAGVARGQHRADRPAADRDASAPRRLVRGDRLPGLRRGRPLLVPALLGAGPGPAVGRDRRGVRATGRAGDRAGRRGGQAGAADRRLTPNNEGVPGSG